MKYAHVLFERYRSWLLLFLPVLLVHHAPSNFETIKRTWSEHNSLFVMLFAMLFVMLFASFSCQGQTASAALLDLVLPHIWHVAHNHAFFAVCREECSYDLANLGFCAITGCNMEDQAAESNGAGKSALAMSAVWALTGLSDARNEVSAPVRWFSLLANVCQYGQTGQVLQCHADTMGHQRLLQFTASTSQIKLSASSPLFYVWALSSSSQSSISHNSVIWHLQHRKE